MDKADRALSNSVDNADRIYALEENMLLYSHVDMLNATKIEYEGREAMSFGKFEALNGVFFAMTFTQYEESMTLVFGGRQLMQITTSPAIGVLPPGKGELLLMGTAGDIRACTLGPLMRMN